MSFNSVIRGFFGKTLKQQEFMSALRILSTQTSMQVNIPPAVEKLTKDRWKELGA